MLGTRSAISVALAGALTLGALTACGDDGGGNDGGTDDAASPISDSSTTTEATTTTLSQEAEVEAAYLRYWQVSDEIAADPNPDDPRIEQIATGASRTQLIDSFTTMQTQGVRVEAGDQRDHRVVNLAVSGDTATFDDCMIDHATRVNDTTGEREEFSPTPTLNRVEMHFVDGAWLVAQLTLPPASEVDPTCNG